MALILIIIIFIIIRMYLLIHVITMLMSSNVTSLMRQTPPLFEIEWWRGSLVNRVDVSVPVKEFGHRFWYGKLDHM